MFSLLAATWLVFTLPTTGQLVWIDPSQGPDSTMVECSGGPGIHEILTARLYGWPVTGGGIRLVAEHSVSGQEGQPDSFPVPWPGMFYVTTTNPAGESCASNRVNVAPTDLTGIGTPDETLGKVLTCVLFDVQGRRVGSFPGSLWGLRRLTGDDLRRGVHRPLSSGIYFLRGRTKAGQDLVRRVVVVR